MFKLLFHAGMSVLHQSFCGISMPTDWRRVRSQKMTHRSGKHAKKRLSLKTFLKGPASNQEFPKCATTNHEFLICAATNGEFLKWAATKRAAHFRNSWFVVGLFKKFLEKNRFFCIFSTSMSRFWLLTFLQSVDMYILKKMVKTVIPAWNKGRNILHPPVWSSHRLLNKWKSKCK